MPPPALSVNINKYALLRNSRGHDTPNLLQAAALCIEAGAQGITVHPRRDQRHVRYDDLAPLGTWLAREHPHIEWNIECEDHPEIVDQVIRLRPHQCTLVPVTPGEVTSDHGYRFPDDISRLTPTLQRLRQAGIRTSLFVDPDPDNLRRAAGLPTDRVEIYTGPYAWAFGTPDAPAAHQAVVATAAVAGELGWGVNAGHDLDRHNLPALASIANLAEVSIGHAQICRALEVGTHQSVQELLRALDPTTSESP
ncbi:MAG: Pyridoxine 5-phosphate synthase [Pseudomonadota bacterium]|jgi:pyridoxine 5-phosphate synthase